MFQQLFFTAFLAHVKGTKIFYCKLPLLCKRKTEITDVMLIDIGRSLLLVNVFEPAYYSNRSRRRKIISKLQ